MSHASNPCKQHIDSRHTGVMHFGRVAFHVSESFGGDGCQTLHLDIEFLLANFECGIEFGQCPRRRPWSKRCDNDRRQRHQQVRLQNYEIRNESY